MDINEALLKYEPYIWEKVESEDEELVKLVHSLICKEIALRKEASFLKRRDEALQREIFKKIDKQYMEIRSKILEDKPIVEIIKALISYGVSLDRVERKLNELRIARYGTDEVVDKAERSKKSEPKIEEEELEEYFQTPEFRETYCGWVDKFIGAPSEEKQWRALEIHYFGRIIGATWPEEVKETLMGILDTIACNRLIGRKTKGDNILETILNENFKREKDEFWRDVQLYVRSKVEQGRMSKRRALVNYYNRHKGNKFIKGIKFESFREAHRLKTKP